MLVEEGENWVMTRMVCVESEMGIKTPAAEHLRYAETSLKPPTGLTGICFVVERSRSFKYACGCGRELGDDENWVGNGMCRNRKCLETPAAAHLRYAGMLLKLRGCLSEMLSRLLLLSIFCTLRRH